MAGKAKSNYLTITDRNHKKVLWKQFFNQGQMNDFIKAENIEEQYPKTEFIIYKECY